MPGRPISCDKETRFVPICKAKNDFICLQDTHINPKLDSFIKSEWGFEDYFSSYTTNSPVVMVLFNNNFEHKVNRVKTDKNGNFIILDMTIEGKKITLVNLYCPNNDKPEFYENITRKVSEFVNEQVIMFGDWNFVSDAEIDSKNYLHTKS